MKVNLINYTQDALPLLIFTKNGRLDGGKTFAEIKSESLEWQLDQLKYMLDTIQTSFEFVDYTFLIEGVSRDFTHQLVRTRTASFQQEALRAVEIKDFEFVNPIGHCAMDASYNMSAGAYRELIAEGVAIQNARSVLPGAICTKIFFKANLRTLSNMAELRLCTRAQGEYQKVFKEIVRLILEVHSWTESLLQVYCVKTGICAFPRYTECPVQKWTIDPGLANNQKKVIKESWEKTNHEANPIAKDGKTM